MIAWICHKLFGWRYWAVDYGTSTCVRRERRYVNGTPYVEIAGNHVVIDHTQRYRKFNRVY